jgi:hypothetical protein
VARITQRAGEITVVRARLLPPPCNTGLVLVDQDRFVRLLLWYGKSVSVLASVRDAGHDVTEVRTWTSLGWRIGKQALALREAS